MTTATGAASTPCLAGGDAPCGRPARQGGKGVALCQEHHDEHRRRQVAEKNAEHAAAPVVLTRGQADALRDGIADLEDAVAQWTTAWQRADASGSLADQDAAQVAHENVALAAETVLRAWRSDLPGRVLPSAAEKDGQDSGGAARPDRDGGVPS